MHSFTCIAFTRIIMHMTTFSFNVGMNGTSAKGFKVSGSDIRAYLHTDIIGYMHAYTFHFPRDVPNGHSTERILSEE